MDRLYYKVRVRFRWWGKLVWSCRGLIRHLPGVRRVAIWVVMKSVRITGG